MAWDILPKISSNIMSNHILLWRSSARYRLYYFPIEKIEQALYFGYLRDDKYDDPYGNQCLKKNVTWFSDMLDIERY